MTLRLSDRRARRLRLRAQQLALQRSDSVTGVAQVVKEVCGVQAQDASAATLAVRVRSAGLTAADVEHARLDTRSVVRTWCMRGTLHLVVTKDLGWLLPMLGPVFIAASRPRLAQLKLDEDTCAKGIRIIRNALAKQGPLTRHELARQLAPRGINAVGQAPIHLIGRAALEGIVCLGPDRGAKPTYVLIEDWIGRQRAMSRDAARAELARRYLNAYGPAGPHDLAAWSGLTIREARTAWKFIADQLIEVEVASRPAWMLKTHTAWLDEPPARHPIVRLLPSFDTYLLGYSSRDLAVAPQHAKRVHPGGGLLRPTLLVDGRALGTWNIKRHRERLDVVVAPFDDLPRSVRPGLDAEVKDLARFLSVKTTLSVMTSR